jgi:hypothetical protein
MPRWVLPLCSHWPVAITIMLPPARSIRYSTGPSGSSTVALPPVLPVIVSLAWKVPVSASTTRCCSASSCRSAIRMRAVAPLVPPVTIPPTAKPVADAVRYSRRSMALNSKW